MFGHLSHNHKTPKRIFESFRAHHSHLDQNDHLWILPHIKSIRAQNNSEVISILNLYTKSKVLIKNSKNGKPYIDKENLHFSLSHTDNQLFLAISRDAIGIDAEIIKPRHHMHRIINRYFSMDPSLSFDDNKNALDFYCLWTAREAFLKLIDSRLFGIKTSKIRIQKNGLLISVDESFLHKARFLKFTPELILSICKMRRAHRALTIF